MDNRPENQLRVPVVSADGTPLMPTTPRKARLMVRDGVAAPRRNKLGVFYLQMLRPVGTATQPVVLGVDPGGLHEGLAVATKEGVNICGQVELPGKVHKQEGGDAPEPAACAPVPEDTAQAQAFR